MSSEGGKAQDEISDNVTEAAVPVPATESPHNSGADVLKGENSTAGSNVKSPAVSETLSETLFSTGVHMELGNEDVAPAGLQLDSDQSSDKESASDEGHPAVPRAELNGPENENHPIGTVPEAVTPREPSQSAVHLNAPQEEMVANAHNKPSSKAAEPPQASVPVKSQQSRREPQAISGDRSSGLASGFGMFSALPGFRAAPAKASTPGGALGPPGKANSAQAVSAKEVADKLQEGAEKLQESAKLAFTSFLSTTAFSKKPASSAHDKVPVVDSPVDDKFVGSSKPQPGGPAQSAGGMWKQLTAMQLPAVASLGGNLLGSDPSPSRAKAGPTPAAPRATSESKLGGGTSESAKASQGNKSALGTSSNQQEAGGEGGELPFPLGSAAPERGGESTPSVLKVAEPGVKAGGTEESQAPAATGGLSAIGQNLVDSSKTSLRALQTRARHMVSQNKRRYQEDGFDLDMAYITESIIAMGFPAGDRSSGILGYVEGLYRNHMEDVLRFLESHHPGKYKVYNLCSERLYDAALFQGKVACFPFDDHNCPPLPMLLAFCESCYDWLKGALDRVCVVHCKAGMARTGLMVCCLLLYIKLFPSAPEAIQYYNTKRAVDGRALVLPSQLRYVHYFERILKDMDGVTPPPRKCIVRGIRLHRCPYWVRPAITISDHSGTLFSTKKHPQTRDLLADDLWHNAPRKGVVVFALPGERCVAEVAGDFKLHFHDRHGDFYCWLNTSMMQTRQLLGTGELDGFEKRRLGSPGFQVEVVILDHDAPLPTRPKAASVQKAAAPPPLPAGTAQGGLTAAATAAASATVSALQAFYGTMGAAGGKPSSTAATAVPCMSTPSASSAELGREVKPGKEEKEVPQEVGNEDIFSDSDGEDEDAEPEGKRKGKGEAQASSALPAFPLPPNASSSSDLRVNTVESPRVGLASEAANQAPAPGELQEAPRASSRAQTGEGAAAAALPEGGSLAGAPKVQEENHRKAPEPSGERSSATEAWTPPSASGGADLADAGPALEPLAAPKPKPAEAVPPSMGRAGVAAVETVAGAAADRSGAGERQHELVVSPSSDFKALAEASAADVSVFTFGDDEDFDDFD